MLLFIVVYFSTVFIGLSSRSGLDKYDPVWSESEDKVDRDILCIGCFFPTLGIIASLTLLFALIGAFIKHKKK